MPKPLDGILVVDFSQFLSGPSAALRLADLGARVIKIERPGTGDLCRQLYVTDVDLDGDSTTFHAINRNKESFAADLKTDADREKVANLLAAADVLIHNFRPGVMERLGFGYEQVRSLHPRLVYASISGYGSEGPWSKRPGQDLLLQAVSGLTWLSGDEGDGPVPMGLSVCDMLAGAQLVQGILACLLRQATTGEGGLVEVNMLEAALDLQIEPLTSFLQDGGQQPVRTALSNAHAYLGAPYGVYATLDGFLAIAMADVGQLGDVLQCPAVSSFSRSEDWFTHRDEIKGELSRHLRGGTTATWLKLLEPVGIWCAPVLNWRELTTHAAFHAVDMEQTVFRDDGWALKTTSLPMRFDGVRFHSHRGSPTIGQHTQAITKEFNLE